MNPTVNIHNAIASVTFEQFDLQAYEMFLRCKQLPESQLDFDVERAVYILTTPARFARLLGVAEPGAQISDLDLASYLFDYQRFIVGTALSAKRYAVFADCGLGKTAMFLEYARHVIHRTNGRVLILSPGQIIPQTQEEGLHGPEPLRRDPCWTPWPYRVEIERLETRAELIEWCKSPGPGLGIVNYEKMIDGIVNEFRYLSGLICDESSILKSGGGVIKWNVIKSARGVEYKLSCTATPAPNDIMEYASQASFLEKLRTEGEILWTFFTRDKKGNWKVKPHAREGFYRFLASWSIYLRSPARYGWANNLKDIPPPEYFEHKIAPSDEQLRLAHTLARTDSLDLFGAKRMGVTERAKFSQLAKGFLYGKDDAGKRTVRQVESAKPAFVAEFVKSEVALGHKVLVWTLFDEEAGLLARLMNGMDFRFAALSGQTPKGERPLIIEDFRKGRADVLVAKASMLGFGMNFQHCTSMVFSGLNDSYEQLYQAVRRAVRYGQTRAVRVHVPFIPELEGLILDNVLRKKDGFERDAETQEHYYCEALKGLI